MKPRVLAKICGAARYSGNSCRYCGETWRSTATGKCIGCEIRPRKKRSRKKRTSLRCWSSNNSRVLNALRQAAGGIVTLEEFVSLLWPNADKKPEYSWGMVRRAVFDLRELGYPIRTYCGRGYSYAPAFKEVPANAPGTQWGVDATLRQVILSP